MNPPNFSLTTMKRVLIWGKTYPEVSRKHVETVCTAGVCEDGKPIRLYPVPLRYLETDQQYKLWSWVDVEVMKSPQDTRPESYRVMNRNIKIVGHIDTDESEWAERRQYVFRDTSWHFTSLDFLEDRREADNTSLAMIQPDSIEGVVAEKVPRAELAAFKLKMQEIQSQAELWDPQYKDLEPMEYRLKVHWRCPDRCRVCVKNPHEYSVLDWGIYEMARRDGKDTALARLEELMQIDRYDTRFFLGNMFTHPKAFCIVGIWYPKRRPQFTML